MRRPIQIRIVGPLSYCLSLLILFFGCGSIHFKGTKSKEVVDSEERRDELDWFYYAPERISVMGDNAFSLELRRDPGRLRMAQGFGVENPEILDLGVYGKVGNATVFVAKQSTISNYDRLYWPLVQVLSKKYGCFIKNKRTRGNTQRFECADRRVIVVQRSIGGGFAKFSGRQFDLLGRELVVKRRVAAYRP